MIAPHVAKWALDRQQRNIEGDTAHVAASSSSIKQKRKPKRERVLQTKGGGQYVPPPPSPMEQAMAREWESKQEFDREQRRQEAANALAAAEKAERDAQWNRGKSAAYNTALSYGKQRGAELFGDTDPYGVMSKFNTLINTAGSGLQPGDEYATVYSPNIFDEVLSSSLTGVRNKNKSAFNAALDPYYAEDMFGATADDAILASILGGQYDTALSDLGAARDRGQLSNIAYDRALKDLGTAKTTANSELQTIGGGVLADIVGDFNTRRTSALDEIGNWNFGDAPYDVGRSTGRVKDYATNRQQGLEGEILTAVGGKEFFDIPSLIGKSTARAGNQTTPSTTGAGALYDTFANEATKKADAVRQNEGIF